MKIYSYTLRKIIDIRFQFRIHEFHVTSYISSEFWSAMTSVKVHGYTAMFFCHFIKVERLLFLPVSFPSLKANRKS